MSDQTPVQRVDRDLACVGCGYNLRTLDAWGVCPECGRTVCESRNTPNDPRVARRFKAFQGVYVGLSGCALTLVVCAVLAKPPLNGRARAPFVEQVIHESGEGALLLLFYGLIWIAFSNRARASRPLRWSLAANVLSGLLCLPTLFAS